MHPLSHAVPFASGMISAAEAPTADHGPAAVQPTLFRVCAVPAVGRSRAERTCGHCTLTRANGSLRPMVRSQQISEASVNRARARRPTATETDELGRTEPSKVPVRAPSLLKKAIAQCGSGLFRSREQTQPLHRTEHGTHHAPPNLRLTAQGLNHEQYGAVCDGTTNHLGSRHTRGDDPTSRWSVRVPDEQHEGWTRPDDGGSSAINVKTDFGRSHDGMVSGPHVHAYHASHPSRPA